MISQTVCSMLAMPPRESSSSMAALPDSSTYVADVGEQLRAGHRGGEVGGVGQRRHLVAEVGARDDGAGRDPEVQIVGGGGADEG